MFNGKHSVLLLIVLLAITAVSCQKKRETSAGKAAHEEPARPEHKNPLLNLEVNGKAQEEIVPGDALVIEALLMHPDALRQRELVPIKINNSNKPWQELVKLKIKNESGAEESWPLESTVADDKETETTLDAGLVESVAWVVSTESLKPGVYELWTELMPFKGSAWREAIASSKTRLTIKAAGEVKAQKPVEVDQIVTLADSLEKSGKKKEAFQAYNQAIEKYENMGLAEIPEDLMARRNHLMTELVDAESPEIDQSIPGKEIQLPAWAEELKRKSQATGQSAAGNAPSPAQPVQAPKVEGDLKITLSWNEAVDVDLKVEDADGVKYKPDQEAEKGPGSESIVITSEKQAGRNYYFGASLIGAMGSKGSVKMILNVPGKQQAELSADLAYDGSHQFWVAFSVNTSSWEVKEINKFDTSIQNYRKKES